MAKRKLPRVYVVVAVHWQYDGGENKTNVRVEGDPVHPLRVFHDRGRAEAHAQELEAARRKQEDPRWYGMTFANLFSDISTKTHEEFLGWLAANEFPVPESTDYFVMDAWWKQVSAKLTPQRRKLLWDQFDKIQFYAVREVELGE